MSPLDIDQLIKAKQGELQRLRDDLAALERVKAMGQRQLPPPSNIGSADARPVHSRRDQFSPTSQVGCAIRVLKELGAEAHVDKIIKEMASRGVKAPKGSVVGSLYRYAKKGRVFYKAKGPNSFGLLEWKQSRRVERNGDARLGA